MCRRVQTGLGFGRALRVEVAEVHRPRIAIWADLSSLRDAGFVDFRFQDAGFKV